MKKFISLFLVFSLVALSGNLYAKEKRGATLIITKKDGQRIKGELIAVKPNSILLLDTEGKDVSIDIVDIKVIRILRKSKLLLGAGLGFLIGAGLGALNGAIGNRDPLFGEYWNADVGIRALSWAPFFAAPGLLIGGLVGAAAGADETIQIAEGLPQASIEVYLAILRKKARIPDYK